MERGKIVAIITGAISIILALAYLLLVQLLDFRGEMIPAPVSQLPPAVDIAQIPANFIGAQYAVHLQPATHQNLVWTIDSNEKRSLERDLEALFGNLLPVVTVAGTDLPLIAMLYRQLEFLDPKNRGNESYEKT